jgi:hypothetical protein
LYGGVEIGQQGDGVGAFGDDRASKGQAAEGEDGEVGETHGSEAKVLDLGLIRVGERVNRMIVL